MSEQDSGQERTEEPTEKKLKESRDNGQVPRSKDFNTTLSLMFAAVGLMVFGGMIGDGLSDVMSSSFTIERERIFDKGYMVEQLWTKIVDAVLFISPFMALSIISVFVGPVMMGGWLFSAKSWKPKMEKLNPLKGFKRMFGMNALVELTKALLKFVLLGTIAYFTFSKIMPDYLALGLNTALQGVKDGADLILWQFLAISTGLIVVSAIDVPYQLFTHKKKLMMTRQQIKEESKETDGNPEMKGKRRQMQYQISQGRMMQDIPEANVILTNPTHFSVALKYDEETGAAPVVIAKGTDLIAFKIREIGDAHNIAIFEAPPLARAIYYTTDIGKEIPSDLYLAVARVLAYIYQINNFKAGTSSPDRPDDLPVPEDYKNLSRKQPKWKRNRD